MRISRPWGAVVVAAACATTLASCALLAPAGAGAPGDAASTSASSAADRSTAPVTRGDLVDSRRVPATLGHGTPTPLASSGEGTVTWLPAFGDVVARDGVLWAVDEVPVRAMHGTVPLWRTLEQGAEGADVAQLNDELRALGYDVVDDDVFGRRTRLAVERWQRDRGREVTGRLGASDVAFVPGDVRVGELRGRVGDPAGQVVWEATGTSLVATASVAPRDLARFGRDAAVEVALPDGTTLPGTVQSVGEPTGDDADVPGGGSDDDSVPVVVAIDGELPEGVGTTTSVDLLVSGDRRDDVLSVPVTALLADGDGYGLEVVRPDGSTRTVPVAAGFFAQGRVEVSGDAVAEGDEVVVPS
jgi:peptidoglycan hydrolase-like protein with peptidoglycan-binding domain